MNLGVMAMNNYSTQSKTKKLEPYHRMQFSVVMSWTYCLKKGSSTTVEEVDDVFYHLKYVYQSLYKKSIYI